tara:strand:+ start:21 stop:206 length:186 start_codon:yes stop_codon:yes gene_type:complete
MTQLEIMIDMQSKGYNVVTCPTECGAVLLIDKDEVDENNGKTTCEYCEFTSINSDFTDLVY